ncbi:hypothetical protein [Streptomyces sp. NPDC055058]
MICHTPVEAFQAGYDEPCEHGVPDPADCPGCRLTDSEIARLAVLHRPHMAPAVRQAA